MIPGQCSDTPANAFTFSDEQLMSICETSDALRCDCPARMVGLLWETRTFYYYVTDCIDRSPEKAKNHLWLSEKLLQVDALLSQIFIEFLQEQGLLDEQQQINLKLLKERQIQAVFAQQR